MSAPDIRELDRRAVQGSVAVVSEVTHDDLTRATPCGEWTLGELLAHMTGQHDGFAAAAAGRGGDDDVWTIRPAGADPVGEYAAAADRVLAAFSEPGVLERKFALPEITTAMTFPAVQAMSFHLIDYVVHGWDVARSLGLPYQVDDELAAVALQVAERVPGGARRLIPGAAFGPVLTAPQDADTLDRTLLILGRSPAWPD
jgi:uncharacterized protein (TIGR03086 family)